MVEWVSGEPTPIAAGVIAEGVRYLDPCSRRACCVRLSGLAATTPGGRPLMMSIIMVSTGGFAIGSVFAETVPHFTRAVGLARIGRPNEATSHIERLAALQKTLADAKNCEGEQR